MERRILVFTPSGQDGTLTERLFKSAGVPVALCTSEFDLAGKLSEGAGALLLTEEALTTTTLSVLRRYVESQQTWSDLPVLLLTRPGTESLHAQRATEQLGNVTLLERPVRSLALVSSARSALRARARQYEMRALNQRKDEFLATLAHELRNPLAPIVNATSIFEKLHPSEQTTKLTGMVNRQINHLTRLIDDLMDVARITSGKLELQVAMTSVSRVVTQAVEIADSAIRERRHTFTLKTPEHDYTLRADHVRLVQSLANVLVNAAKFTPPGGDISLDAEVKGHELTFRVKDSGRGLSQKSLHAIFEMFAQGRAPGEPSTGLGLGLHLAKGFTEMHAGSISAYSEGPDKGSEFVIRLPIVVPENERQAQAPSDEAAPLQLPQHVLVVDDNEDAAGTLQTLLSMKGITVSVAHDGEAAVAMTAALRPDAVVMEIGMPRMNGYEAARQIRAHTSPGGPMLIALTGWGQYADRVLAAEAGFDHHFVKPIDLQRLLACLAGA